MKKTIETNVFGLVVTINRVSLNEDVIRQKLITKKEKGRKQTHPII